MVIVPIFRPETEWVHAVRFSVPPFSPKMFLGTNQFITGPVPISPLGSIIHEKSISYFFFKKQNTDFIVLVFFFFFVVHS